MPRQPWTGRECGFETLRVPAHTQPDDEADCIIYCLWMVSSYVGNEYPDRNTRDQTNVPTIDDIKKFTKTDELGWQPNQSDLTDLSASVSTVHFSLESWHSNPPKPLTEIAEQRLDEDLPIIAIIDAQLLRHGIRGSGPMHAIIIVGTDSGSDQVAIADPWYATIHAVGKDNLEDAWDPMLHQIIDVEVAQTNESASRGEE